MNSSLAAEAVEVGEVLRESIAAAGGVDLLRRSVEDPGVRDEAAGLVDAIGLWEVRPLDDPLELEVAASACRAAGFHALPYPVAERLARTTTDGALALVSDASPVLVSHGDLPFAWQGVDLEGRLYALSAEGGALGTKLAPFAVSMTADVTGQSSAVSAALAVTLQAWWLLGLLEHALEDTVRYTREREQFGRSLIRFQGVGFQLADMSVAVESLEALAKYTVWRLNVARAEALIDAIALRTSAQQSVDLVMRCAYQLHGAMGFTDEVDVSWLSRASQFPRRIPEGRHESAGRLLAMIEREGWAEFGHTAGPRTPLAE